MAQDIRIKAKMLTLKSRIMLYTLTPTFIMLLIAGIFLTVSIRYMIDNFSRSEVQGNTGLAYNRVCSLLDEYGQICVSKTDEDNLKHFLQTAVDRDSIEDNAYFSHAMGELDSVISDHSKYFERAWIASATIPDVAFSNSSDGWTATADYNIKDWEYFDKVSSSDSYYITNPYESSISGEKIVTVAAPVRDTRTGVLLGVFGLDIKDTGMWVGLTDISQGDENELYISSANNMILHHPEVDRLGGFFTTLEIKHLGHDGMVSNFTCASRKMFGTRGTPQNTEWIVYVMRDYSETAELISTYTRITVIVFIAVTVVLFITINVASGKIAKPLQDYTKLINEMQFKDESQQQQLLRPEGCRELEHFAIGFNSLIERNTEILSQLREMNIRSEKERILYQTALQSSTDVVFEYDIETDVLIAYGSVFDATVPKTIGTVHDGFLARIQNGDEYYSEDISAAEEFFAGKIKGEAVISHKLPNNNISWLSFAGTAVYADKIPVKVVGKIHCIDDVIRLRNGAERDSFTGFYNKLTTEKVISKRLARSGSGAILLVDIDNFKSINDYFGHDYGDDVIKEIAAKIKKNIGKADIAGRIGGDEFLLYLADGAKESVIERAEKLCASIRHTYTEVGKDCKVEVSSSIGIAFAPEHGTDFDSLYRSADIAMYVSKVNGKNRFTVFEGQTRPEYKGR